MRVLRFLLDLRIQLRRNWPAAGNSDQAAGVIREYGPVENTTGAGFGSGRWFWCQLLSAFCYRIGLMPETDRDSVPCIHGQYDEGEINDLRFGVVFLEGAENPIPRFRGF